MAELQEVAQRKVFRLWGRVLKKDCGTDDFLLLLGHEVDSFVP